MMLDLLGRYKIYVGLALLAAAILTLVYCSGRRDGKAVIEQKIDRANIKVIKTDAAAREAAAEARVTDAEAVLELKKELVDAVEDTPDEKPDAVRIALGCQRLSRAGKDTAAIPACAGH